MAIAIAFAMAVDVGLATDAPGDGTVMANLGPFRRPPSPLAWLGQTVRRVVSLNMAFKGPPKAACAFTAAPGRLDDWTTGRLDDWTTGRLDDSTTRRLDDWTTRRLDGPDMVC
ncbi:hypothetical protein HYALB_00006596 [Hymenoscyphus albidus]|uniref:Uncharacterized protein n=1 Tax=Hymenoscyphus albidus TaxID=595503 RepID=A0A9N9LUA1_9HELO|nr:hypothetical protein HYALB_00006596 [Hymenoscyphus albidus]